MTQLGLITRSTFDTTTVMFGLRNPNAALRPSPHHGLAALTSCLAVSLYNVTRTSDALAFANVHDGQGYGLAGLGDGHQCAWRHGGATIPWARS